MRRRKRGEMSRIGVLFLLPHPSRPLWTLACERETHLKLKSKVCINELPLCFSVHCSSCVESGSGPGLFWVCSVLWRIHKGASQRCHRRTCLVPQRTSYFLPFYNLKSLLSPQGSYWCWRNHLNKRGSSMASWHSFIFKSMYGWELPVFRAQTDQLAFSSYL